MVWSCAACTFDNVNDGARACSICGTARVKKQQQSSLIDLTETSSFFQPRKASTTKTKPLVENNAGNNNNNNNNNNKRKRKLSEKRDGEGENLRPTAAASSTKPAGPLQQTTLTGFKAAPPNKLSFGTLQEKAEINMKKIFGIDALRSLQPVAINNVLNGKSQIIVMATGGGKSLCYQLPATVLFGVTIVVSPLIALMVDQVRSLNEKGIPAEMISSANGEKHNMEVMERVLQRRLQAPTNNKKNRETLQPITLLYVTPESVQSNRFRAILKELHQNKRLAQFAIDEAHAVSEWGHDFRPAYRKLSWLRSSFPNVPCLACTATATKKVIRDIRESLLMKENEVPCHLASFNRPNVSYEVRYKDTLDQLKPEGAMGDVIDFVQSQHDMAASKSQECSGIIYVHKRQDTVVLARQISRKSGVVAAGYHGGMKDNERKKVQEDWTSGRIQVAVATVAFGMGIDLAHVRYVIHWSVAKTVEGFYQESGRAGRDGLPSVSVVYFSKQDVSRMSFVMQKSVDQKKKDNTRSLEALQIMTDYCATAGCRRQFLLRHFGEEIKREVCRGACDYCQNPQKIRRRIETAMMVRDVIRFKQQRDEPEEWDHGAWGQPEEEEVDDVDVWEVDYDGMDEGLMPTSGETASSILSKYEKLEKECKGDDNFDSIQTNGFVRFKSKPTATSTVLIPEHLLQGRPDPLGHLQKKKKNNRTASTELSAKAQQLKEELARLKADQERLLSLPKRQRLPPPPPPPTFSKK